LTGLPCHIITVNDYLAERDTAGCSPVPLLLGVRGLRELGNGPAARREGYRQEVTYTTNKEIVADFCGTDSGWAACRTPAAADRLPAGRRIKSRKGWSCGHPHRDRGRGDSILIDEAVTPLIISRSLPNEVFSEACRVAHELRPAWNATATTRWTKSARKSSSPLRRISPGRRIRDSGARYRGLSGYLELVHQALTAGILPPDKQYVLDNGKVSSWTSSPAPDAAAHLEGRAAPVHRSPRRAGADPPSETLARLSFQRFYRFFRRLSGMTGTAASPPGVLGHLPPAHGQNPGEPPCRGSICHPGFRRCESKWQALVGEILRVHAQDGRSWSALATSGQRKPLRPPGPLAAGAPGAHAVRHQEEA